MKGKMLLRLIGWFILCFLAIFLIVFFGAHKLFESGDPIQIEIGAAMILSVFMFGFSEVNRVNEEKIRALEERIAKLENRNEGDSHEKQDD